MFSGMLSVEVQEDMREAANNLVKHFHKPEQEVSVRVRPLDSAPALI